jgi:hypothetical protein
MISSSVASTTAGFKAARTAPKIAVISLKDGGLGFNVSGAHLAPQQQQVD